MFFLAHMETDGSKEEVVPFTIKGGGCIQLTNSFEYTSITIMLSLQESLNIMQSISKATQQTKAICPIFYATTSPLAQKRELTQLFHPMGGKIEQQPRILFHHTTIITLTHHMQMYSLQITAVKNTCMHTCLRNIKEKQIS